MWVGFFGKKLFIVELFWRFRGSGGIELVCFKNVSFVIFFIGKKIR